GHSNKNRRPQSGKSICVFQPNGPANFQQTCKEDINPRHKKRILSVRASSYQVRVRRVSSGFDLHGSEQWKTYVQTFSCQRPTPTTAPKLYQPFISATSRANPSTNLSSF